MCLVKTDREREKRESSEVENTVDNNHHITFDIIAHSSGEIVLYLCSYQKWKLKLKMATRHCVCEFPILDFRFSCSPPDCVCCLLFIRSRRQLPHHFIGTRNHWHIHTTTEGNFPYRKYAEKLQKQRNCNGNADEDDDGINLWNLSICCNAMVI